MRTDRGGCSRCWRSCGAAAPPPLTRTRSTAPATATTTAPRCQNHLLLLRLLPLQTWPVAGRAGRQTQTSYQPTPRSLRSSGSWTRPPSECTGSRNPSLCQGHAREIKKHIATHPSKINTLLIYLKIVEYTSHLMPPVQYINMSVFSLSTPCRGSVESICIYIQ